MRKTGKRWLAAFLCLMMALTLLPLQAFAAEADTAPAGVLAEFSKEGLAELSTGTMKVYVDEAFPRVVRYVLNPGTDKETAVDGLSLIHI